MKGVGFQFWCRTYLLVISMMKVIAGIVLATKVNDGFIDDNEKGNCYMYEVT